MIKVLIRRIGNGLKVRYLSQGVLGMDLIGSSFFPFFLFSLSDSVFYFGPDLLRNEDTLKIILEAKCGVGG